MRWEVAMMTRKRGSFPAAVYDDSKCALAMRRANFKISH